MHVAIIISFFLTSHLQNVFFFSFYSLLSTTLWPLFLFYFTFGHQYLSCIIHIYDFILANFLFIIVAFLYIVLLLLVAKLQLVWHKARVKNPTSVFQLFFFFWSGGVLSYFSTYTWYLLSLNDLGTEQNGVVGNCHIPMWYNGICI